MSKEVRIGLLALVAVAVSLWGIKFIQGSNILQRSDVYHVYFNEVGGIQIGTSVKISGVTVGSVSAIELNLDDRRVRLDIAMNRSVPLPKNTLAVLATTGVMGDKAIILQYDQPCNGDNCAQSGDTLKGQYQGLVESMVGEGGVEGYIGEFKKALLEITDTLNNTLLGDDSQSPIASTARDLQSTMANMKLASSRFNSLLQRTAPSMEQSLNNIGQLTQTLESQRQHIADVIANADSLSQQMVDGQLDEAIVKIKSTIDKLDQTMATANTTLASVSTVMDKVQKGEGSLGKLVQDEALYNNLNALSFSMDSLMVDFQDKPYRYMPLKSRRRVKKFDRQDNN